MIQSAYASSDLTPVDEFWKTVNTADVMDSKLRVVFSAASQNPATPSPPTAVQIKRTPSPPDVHHSAKETKADAAEDVSHSFSSLVITLNNHIFLL